MVITCIYMLVVSNQRCPLNLQSALKVIFCKLLVEIYGSATSFIFLLLVGAFRLMAQLCERSGSVVRNHRVF